MGFENVGRVWTPQSLREHLTTLGPAPSWIKAICLHHTGAPSLAQRPRGLTAQHIENIASFYRREKGWSTAPHLFIDDDQIFGMCDLRRKGIHAASFNSKAIGIEVLGDYDVENPLSGRGLTCWTLAAQTTRVLLEWLKLEATEQTVLFHRDDPKTSKSCPGRKVTKEWVLRLIREASAQQPHPADDRPVLPIPWEQWTYRGKHWCVPVYAYMTAMGVEGRTVRAELRGMNGEFFYGKQELEGAFYEEESTWAPVRELQEILQRSPIG
ncbi:MAG: N-acetylmuramoyl-L-alanine amidase [Verrucomicrobiaceae bacterium]|nr:MAG: N-acetylmuramoyl-L-alanine amidase [Verrucomicrobiaceae bacterium]